MGVFSKMLNKLGIKSKEEKAAEKAAAAKPEVKPVIPRTTTVHANKPTAHESRPVASKLDVAGVDAKLSSVAAAAPAAMEMVDVVAKLEKLAVESPEKLDWKASIVDLMKLLGLDSSLAERKELAQELGCPPEKSGGDYAEMNVWLHKTVLQKIAENGGNIPQNLLD